ncbi:protein-L-isoaspartate(D-aspartate) O-methyltransferase [Candidatus Poribacteria bacterium]|nr:protein-L-isoaspartate(D-aspartate) O-methyltransferase [Candidatus Poribacteria bacterium]MXY26838.1 protein-L-isoaspartate(D-aspartate) O-methyltransferase [Candidatus Poribacteria bacterium]MYK19409.1 protein-L-isoaspartate(D-aspartate) O-methyltransferase [Candidatus Poribacteria bacterium]
MLLAKNYETLRKKMVKDQIEARGIRDPRTLAVMQKVERHLFVKPEYLNIAYRDGPLPIHCQQTVSQPYIVALMTDLLRLTPTSKVLEIGTGCGYQTAILAELAGAVYSVEILPTLAKSAKARLERLNYRNISFKEGNGHHGWQEYAPYDAVLVAAAPKVVPEHLVQQLGEGGRMVIPVGDSEQNLLLIQKKPQIEEGSEPFLETTEVTGVSFVPMTGSPN